MDDFPSIRKTKSWRRMIGGSIRNTLLFLLRVDRDEIRVEEVETGSGRIVGSEQFSRHAFTNSRALRAYQRSHRSSKHERDK
jgi:hypothetical protein